MWVTRELLLNIFNHSLELRIWDSKEKVSARARFDRPKAFRLPAGQENEEDAGNHGGSNVKALVLNQSISHAQLQPKESREMKGMVGFSSSTLIHSLLSFVQDITPRKLSLGNSYEAHFTTEIVASILAPDTRYLCEKNQSILYRKAWVFSGYSRSPSTGNVDRVDWDELSTEISSQLIISL